MVGFGSSLRMARRAGWERAYLDYETLKMLLSQIEAVYEEEWHRQRTEDDAFEDDRPRGRKRSRGDYRDFLFLEPDSDVAFASSASELLGGQDSSDYSTDEETGQKMESISAFVPSQAKPFTLYSQETESDEEDSIGPDECGGRSLTSFGWRRESKTAVVEGSRKSRRKSSKRRAILSPLRADQPSDFFVGGPDTFLGQEGGESPDPEPSRGSSSLLNTSFQRGFSTEGTALLQQPTSEGGGSFYSFNNRGSQALTPPKDFSGGVYYPGPISVGVNVTSSEPQSLSLPRLTPGEVKRKKLEAERRRKRRQRVRRRRAKRREELERRVPPHLRLAHAKARSITERFLGLLRAEVEKVTLFAQSRLGELADTAGSLRFQMDDDSEFGGFSSRSRSRGGGYEGFSSRSRSRGGGYEHPLSDGGMHPSASSSDDEHRANGIFPWSDTSDEDEHSEAGSKTCVSPRPEISTGKASSTTIRITNKASSTDKNASFGNKPTKLKSTAFAAAHRQINHFTMLRCERPTFQRYDHIVGEELLLLSAVDEADGYTAVAVELMHVLRFICVNVIAVRKICRKHDRLLTSRMLGGYYHRKHKATEKGKDGKKGRSSPQHSLTLGSMVSRSLGEDCEVDPSAASGLNQNKLVGVYDLKVQGLANSPTVRVVSSCLALALSEYEVSESRADALSKLNSTVSRAKTAPLDGAGEFTGGLKASSTAPVGCSPSRWISSMNPRKKKRPEFESLGVMMPYDSEMDSDPENTGPRSTSSNVSLTRLRFAVMSVFALRESARFKLDFHKVFLCRSLLAFNGPNVVGEGLDGCSREVLDFFVAYNPDAALLLDSSDLYQGLQEGKWRTVPIGRIMLSALSTAVTSPVFDTGKNGMGIQDAVSIMPTLSVHTLDNNDVGRTKTEGTGDEYDDPLLKLSRVSSLLYSMNDYIIHATANTFVRSTQAHPAYSANLIGATKFAALFVTGLHCYRLTRGPLGNELSAVSLRTSFVLAAAVATLGNAIYIVGVQHQSIAISVIGRLLVGLASSDPFHRQIVTDCVPAVYVVPESARLINWNLYGRVWGLVVGAILGSFNLKIGRTTIGAFQSASYLMCFLWVIQAFRLLFMLPQPVKRSYSEYAIEYDVLADGADVPRDRTESQSEEFGSDESEGNKHNPESMHYESSPDVTQDERKANYTAAERALMRKTEADDEQEYNATSKDAKKNPLKGSKLLAKRLRKLFLYNVALPVTLAILVLVKITHEIIFTSCPIITYRYFKWSGSHAALFLAALSASVLVINYFCGIWTKMYDERTVIKRSLLIFGTGLLVMINYASLFSLASQVENLLDETDETTYREVHPYDGMFGIVQYVIGFTVAFTGILTLEGATLSLMSKVAPSRLKSAVINCGTIVTFFTLAARVLGDIEILFVGLSHRLINTDIVNSLVIPYFLACIAAYYLVKIYFFFLM